MHPTAETAEVDFAAALEAAKLKALYHFAYGLSHEINNPLANIATRAQTLLVDERDPERRRKLATIVQQAFRAHEMIADLMLFAHPPTPRFESTDLVKLADTIVQEVEEQAREQGTSVVRSGDPGPLVASVDPTQIGVALKALVQNSLEALRSSGHVEIAVGRCDARAETIEYSALGTKYSVLSTQYPVATEHCCQPISFATIHPAHSTSPAAPHDRSRSNPRSAMRPPRFFLSVSDNGPGIPPKIRPHLFDPFFSGREAGRGLGLGLCKAWRIAELHGGQIIVESQPGHGATFTIVLPGDDSAYAG